MLAQQVSPPEAGTSSARSAMRLAGADASDESMCQTAVAGLYPNVTMSMIVSNPETDWSTENGSVHGVPNCSMNTSICSRVRSWSRKKTTPCSSTVARIARTASSCSGARRSRPPMIAPTAGVTGWTSNAVDVVMGRLLVRSGRSEARVRHLVTLAPEEVDLPVGDAPAAVASCVLVDVADDHDGRGVVVRIDAEVPGSAQHFTACSVAVHVDEMVRHLVDGDAEHLAHCLGHRLELLVTLGVGERLVGAGVVAPHPPVGREHREECVDVPPVDGGGVPEGEPVELEDVGISHEDATSRSPVTTERRARSSQSGTSG